MKQIEKIIPIAFSVALLFFAACKKTPVSGGSASVTTLTGAVFADLDLTNDTVGNPEPREHAPVGTKITVLVNPNDLQNNPDTTKKYDEYRYIATVDANGNYTVQIPAKNSGTKLRIIQDDFVYQTIVGSSTTVRTIYSGPAVPTQSMIYAGTQKVLDLNY